MLTLPTADGQLQPYALTGTPLVPRAPIVEHQPDGTGVSRLMLERA